MRITIKNDKSIPDGEYELTSKTKIDEARRELPNSTSDRELLLQYDKKAGEIKKDGVTLPPQSLWVAEKNRSIEQLSDEELLAIKRGAENSNIPGSRYQQAVNELDIRHQKKLEEAAKKPTISIGILNRGKSNKFINNTFEGLDIGIQDEGEKTLAKGNKFIGTGENIRNFSVKHPWSFAIITGLILIAIGYVLKIILGF